MILFALAGLWALVFGGITITGSLSLEGRRARLYGATLIGLALLLFLLGPVIERITPAVLLENDIARIAVNAVLAAAVIIGLVFPFREKAKSSTA